MQMQKLFVGANFKSIYGAVYCLNCRTALAKSKLKDLLAVVKSLFLFMTVQSEIALVKIRLKCFEMIFREIESVNIEFQQFFDEQIAVRKLLI